MGKIDRAAGKGTGESVSNTSITSSDSFLCASLFNNHHVCMLIIDPLDGRIIDANPGACHFYGYSRQEFSDLKIIEISTSPEKEIFLNMQSAMVPGGALSHSLQRLKSGEIRSVEVSSGPVARDGRVLLCSIVFDITDRERKEEQLRESEERLRLLLDSMKDHAVFMVTADGNIKSWNDAAGRVNGYAKDEVFGKSIASFFAPDAQHARSGELLETAEKQGQAEWDGWMVKKDGAWFWAHVCITPLFDNTDALYGYSVVLRDTTENRRTEELLREREELYRTLIETSPAAIVLFDTDSRILMINQQAAALFGFENREDVFGESVFNYIVPEDRQRAREGIAKLSPKGEKNKYYNCLKKDGSHFIGSLSSSIIGDADGKPKLYIGMIIDVTEQWTSEERIRKAAEEWRATFDAINDFIVILDKDMRITRVNKACAAAYHSTPQELLGKHCYEVFHGQNEIPAFCYYGKVIRDKNTVVEELFEPTVGKQLEATVSPIFDKEGNIDGTVHVFKDITERKKIDELLRSEKEAVERLASERTKELVTARIKLEQAKRLSDVGTLAATVAHELRNPLGVIRTAAYNIKRKSQGEGLKGHLANIEKKIIESDQIINNLLFYSRIKMPNYEKVNLCALVEECVASAKDRFHKWSVVVKGHYGGIIDGYIDADPLQIGELFNNIINNAYEALPDKTGMIDIRGGLDGIGNIWVSIKDNGPGIDKEDLGRLTEPFFTKKSKGTGLGLTVCRQIVELHGGKMYIDSQKDAGTTVTISLPVVLRTR